MATALPIHRLSAEEFADRPDARGYELVRGEMVELPKGVDSSFTGSRIGAVLDRFCQERDAGVVFTSDAAIRCSSEEPDTVRKPDAFFVSKDRFPRAAWGTPYCPVAPNIVVEAVSPNDLSIDPRIKIEEYLAAGVRLVWVIWPAARVAEVHRMDGTLTKLGAEDFLDGEAVLPDFRCRLADVLPPA